MQKIEECPVCHNQSFLKHSHVKDYSITQEEFNLDSCSQCGFVFTNPRPLDKDLSKYYESEVYISHSGTNKGIINKLYHIVQNINLKIKFNTIKQFVPRGTWADYGAGNGAFLSFLNDKNVDNIGFEPDDTARSLGIKKGGNILDTEKYSSNEQKFASITMWHVLEHVSNLNELLKIHSEKLVKGGILTIAVPNHHSYDAKYYKEYWAAYDVPRHLWHFTESDVIRLAEKTGLTHVKTKGMIFDSYYISMLSEKYKGNVTLKGIIIGAISNLKARFTSSPFSSQIYVFKK